MGRNADQPDTAVPSRSRGSGPTKESQSIEGPKLSQEDRRQLHAVVDVTSYENWQSLASSAGVNLTALLDALGLHLDEVLKLRTPAWRQVIEEAQQIQTVRRRRLPQT